MVDSLYTSGRSYNLLVPQFLPLRLKKVSTDPPHKAVVKILADNYGLKFRKTMQVVCCAIVFCSSTLGWWMGEKIITKRDTILRSLQVPNVKTLLISSFEGL